MALPLIVDFEETLFRVFGFSGFRKGQKDIIEAIVVHRKDVCCIMATGHGKSVCFQLPAILMKKPSIIISPLLSLMTDQQINLEKNGIRACCYSSSLSNTSSLRDEILANQYQVIYITPETMVTSTDFFMKLNDLYGLSVIAIDEAHCISSWGNSFRPSYLKLSNLKAIFPRIPILALTGTATKHVESDILRLLNLNQPLRIRTSADRPNLSYWVRNKTNPLDDLLPLLSSTESTIIYCPTRADTEKLTQLLTPYLSIQAYHAGLSSQVRNEIHHQFTQNKLSCIVATICFGMGIDKADIRKVIHYGCPKDLESYVQETGRAGRDGLFSECYVFFNQADFATNRYFLKDINDPSLRSHCETMIHAIEKFLYLITCRRQFILSYFGEELSTSNSRCCDNCLQEKSHSETNIGPDVLNFLSLLSTYNDKFGKLMHINIIRGSNTKKLFNCHRQSPYYGIGKIRSLEWWKTTVQYLINSDLISEKSLPGGYGSVIGLSPLGRAWLIDNTRNPIFILTTTCPTPFLQTSGSSSLSVSNSSGLSSGSSSRLSSGFSSGLSSGSSSRLSSGSSSGLNSGPFFWTLFWTLFWIFIWTLLWIVFWIIFRIIF